MTYFVYILQSQKDGSYYKGYTSDTAKRLDKHNSGLSIYTSKKCPWKLIYTEEQLDKLSAIRRERILKNYSREKLEALIASPKNLMNKMA
ncbi:MAG: GIY-YIG nuclease family protein [Flavobacteriales bacterium]